jgi:hypothetical protein
MMRRMSALAQVARPSTDLGQGCVNLPLPRVIAEADPGWRPINKSAMMGCPGACRGAEEARVDALPVSTCRWTPVVQK